MCLLKADIYMQMRNTRLNIGQKVSSQILSVNPMIIDQSRELRVVLLGHRMVDCQWLNGAYSIKFLPIGSLPACQAILTIDMLGFRQ